LTLTQFVIVFAAHTLKQPMTERGRRGLLMVRQLLGAAVSVTAERVWLMTTPLEIHFHGLEKSVALEARITDKVAKLRRHFDRMSACRVVLEAPHRSPAKAKVYQVKIEISVPGKNPIIITHEREGAHAQEDLGLAVRDAFLAALRRVDEVAAMRDDRGKSERGRRRPRPNRDEGGDEVRVEID
jgi:putative sigma-54 modulation protein